MWIKDFDADSWVHYCTANAIVSNSLPYRFTAAASAPRHLVGHLYLASSESSSGSLVIMNVDEVAFFLQKSQLTM